MLEKKSVTRLVRAGMGALSAICVLAFFPWLTACAYLKPLPETVQKQVDEAINYNLDGIIVYIDIADREPEFYAAGWNDRDLKTPTDPHSLFKIASISKLYIAAATVMLIDDKKLDLDGTLSDYCPELASRIANANSITLRMLLQHKSGIPDWIDDPEFPWTTSFENVDEYLELVLDEPANFNPGSRYEYSNTNYLLLGRILDKTLGYDHNQYIQCNILAPLGLKNTYGTMGDVKVEDLSSGYFSDYGEDVKLLNIVSPGGSMIATAEDVGIFLRALNDGSLLSRNEQAIYSSVYEYEHTGEWVGYTSIARYHKDIDTIVIQFVNTSGGDTWMFNNIIYNRINRIVRKRDEMK